MENKLPARPNIEHLRSQAKTLLSRVNAGDNAAAKIFIENLPAAAELHVTQVRAAGFKLADAQSAIARMTGFASWPTLMRHVDQLRQFQGVWEFSSLEIDGAKLPAEATAGSRILMDGDRFRTESPAANYEGIFNIDVEQQPHHIDIEFVEGPEAGNWSYGIYELKRDRLKICLGLTGASRPERFETSPGSGHALEVLHRASRARPVGVDGGSREAVDERPKKVDPAEFDAAMTPLLAELEGEWSAIELVRDGQALPEAMLKMGKRVGKGNETKVVFGGQTMVHAKVRIDETQDPVAVDYLSLAGAARGSVSYGIMEWVEGDARFCMAPVGADRPTDFSCEAGSGRTVSRWRRKVGRG